MIKVSDHGRFLFKQINSEIGIIKNKLESKQ